MSAPPSTLPDIASAKLPATYEAAKTALSECSRIDECQQWADKAEALASYAKQAEDDQLRKMADRIQARAIRRCGELLKQIEPAHGANQNIRDGTVPKVTRSQAATDAGLSERQRKTALRVANVPEPDFNAAVESESPPTVTSLADRGKKSRPVVDLGDASAADFAAATQALGRLREFAEFVARTDAEVVARGMKPQEAARVRDHIQAIDGWLDQLITRV